MKTCTRCKETKPFDDFCKQTRSKDGYQPACKPCMNDLYNRSRKKKQKHYQDVAKKRQKLVVEKYKLWKQTQSCISCGEDDDACLDLHHTNHKEKETHVSDAVYKWSWNRVLKEIEKCVVVCANCHRKIHAGKIKLRMA